MSRSVFHARWVLPVSSPPIENGRIVAEDGLITAVEAATTRASSEIDFGDAIILPGFVNAHTHCELTFCENRVPFEGSFTGWIERLVSLYPAIEGDVDARLRESIRDGLTRSLTGGVTTLADIGYGPRAVDEWQSAPANLVGFLEALGMGPRAVERHERSIAVVGDLLTFASDVAAGEPVRRYGISPHAPYSTAPAIYREAIGLVQRSRRPICTHLAETRDEIQFLTDASGPFRDLLERRGLWDDSFEPPGCSPVEYVKRLGLLETNPLLIHVNYVTDGDLEALEGFDGSVAFCPRAHAFFDHEPHRYAEMLKRGINVCIGTDSLASNASLSVLDELRFLRSRDTMIDSGRLLSLGTLAGARALGLEARVGSLEPGKRADLVVVSLESMATREPIEELLGSGTAIRAVYVAGQPVDAR